MAEQMSFFKNKNKTKKTAFKGKKGRRGETHAANPGAEKFMDSDTRTGVAVKSTYMGTPKQGNPGIIVAEGKITRIIAQRDTWASIKVLTPEGQEYLASGSIIMPQNGASITMEGRWVNTERYGREFKASRANIEIVARDDRELTSLLSSKFVNGVGKDKAKAIVNHFGKDTLRIVENDYMRLTEVPGIGMKTAKTIHNSFTANRCHLELAKILKPEASDALINRIYSFYSEKGENAVEKISENPYILIRDFVGIGFKKADAMAVVSMGMDKHDRRRIEAAVIAGLDAAANEGHCFVPLNDISAYANKVAIESQNEGFSDDEIKTAIKSGIREKSLVIERCTATNADGHEEPSYIVYNQSVWKAENKVADMLCELLKTPISNPISQEDIDYGIELTEATSTNYRTGEAFQMETLQKDAVKQALTNSVSVVTGGPGTGKTTCLKAMLNAYTQSNSPSRIVLCAPTGRAAARMNEVTGYPAHTIHYYCNLFKRSDNMDDRGLLVIADETSMLDINTATMLLRLVSKGGRLVLIGDPDQLPSVGAGNFLIDVIESGVVPVVRLKVGYRNSGSIAKNADRINHGKGIDSFDLDDEFQFISSHNENLRDDLLDEYYRLVDEYGLENVCCICPIRKSGRGYTSTEDLNLIIRDKLNPIPTGRYVPTGKFGVTFRENDRVMLTKNTAVKGAPRPFVNGDIGTIIAVHPSTVAVKFDDDVITHFDRAQFETDFILAYASTVHKCQGQEYEAIVTACAKEHLYMLERNLLYTAITRAKKHCTLVGEGTYVTIAAKTVKGRKRNTLLKSRLQKNIAKKLGG